MALVLVATALLVAAPMPVLAQAASSSAPSLPAQDDTSKDTPNLAEQILVAPREPRCDEGLDSITVCGKKKDNAKERVPLPGELAGATNGNIGVPRAPDVMANRITGRAISLGCGLMACPQEMLPDIDFRAIPPAPDGSDADRIGKGEIRGN